MKASINIFMFVIGWLVFVYLQMENSLKSSSNGLTNDWKGMKLYLRSQSDSLVWRAFFSAIFYPALIQKAVNTIEPALAVAGLQIYAWGFSGLAGFGAYGFLYQITGLIGFLRGKEMHEVIPPSEDTPHDQQTRTGSQAGTSATPDTSH